MRGVHQSLEVQSHASAGLCFFFRVGILRRCEQAGPRRRPPTTHTTSTSAAGRASTAPRTLAADKQHYRRHAVLTPRDVLALPASYCTLVMRALSRGSRWASPWVGLWPQASAPRAYRTKRDLALDCLTIDAATWPICRPHARLIVILGN
jgi:hypothetical protein